MSFEPLDYLRHILIEADYLLEQSEGLHGYFGVDYQLVWEVVQQKVPDLRSNIHRILGGLQT